MKNLAELLIELAKIPNPEKVGIATMYQDSWTPMKKDDDMTQLSSIETLYLSEQAAAMKQGITHLVLF